MEKYADLSSDGVYRYQLDRVWKTGLSEVAWICLNPSTADAETDDPTVRKIVGFSERWGYGGFVLFNLFALRATDPRELLRHPDPVGPNNQIQEIAERVKAVGPDPPILAWGRLDMKFVDRAMEMACALGESRCLGYTSEGHPRHPLMLAYKTELVPIHWY